MFSPSRVISPLPLCVDWVSFSQLFAIHKMLQGTGHQNKYCGVLKVDCAKEEKESPIQSILCNPEILLRWEERGLESKQFLRGKK